MVNQEHVEDRGVHGDMAKSEPVTPAGDQQQATQQKTVEAVEAARKHGEHVVDEAEVKGQQVANRAETEADRQKEHVADRMESTADTLRDRGNNMPGGQTAQRISGAAADKMNQAADFLHQRNAGDMMEKVQEFTRSHPTAALIGAGAIGLFLGRKLFS
jgi:ElaB/YqjD/DUF883 family membrane-anchored ribosome-binding protein